MLCLLHSVFCWYLVIPCTYAGSFWSRLFLGDTYPSLTGVGYMPFSSDHATWAAWTVIYTLLMISWSYCPQSWAALTWYCQKMIYLQANCPTIINYSLYWSLYDLHLISLNRHGRRQVSNHGWMVSRMFIFLYFFDVKHASNTLESLVLANRN